MPRTKIAYRTTIPWDGGELSPLTDKSKAVPAFGGTPLIQDILNGEPRPINDVRSRGNWAGMGNDEDVSKSYREDGDEFMLRTRLRNIDTERALKKNRSRKLDWVVEMEDGTEYDFTDAQTAKTVMDRMNKPYRRIFRRMAQTVEHSHTNAIAKALQSCVVVESTSSSGTELGAGFHIGGGVFMTCAHVIKSYTRRVMPHAGETSGFSIKLRKKDSESQATLIAIDYSKDIALVRADFNVPALKIANTEDVMVGEEVFSIGNPRGFEDNVSDGIVSSKNRTVFLHEGAPSFIFTDAHVLPGNSGGPLLLYRTGDVIGMMTMIVGGGTSLYGLNAALPGEFMLSFMQENNVSTMK